MLERRGCSCVENGIYYSACGATAGREFSRQDASFNLRKIRVGLIGDPQRQSSSSIPRHLSGLFLIVGKELVEIEFLCMFPQPIDSCYCLLFFFQYSVRLPYAC